MSIELNTAKVLVTGATGGIGEVIARTFAARGASVVVTGRRVDVLQPLADELGATAVAADLSDRSAVERLADEHGDVDIVIHNAALPASGALDDYTVEQTERALQVNLAAPIVLTQLLLPGMKQRGRGHHVYVSSMAAKVPTADTSLYTATKLGLRGFAQSLRLELAPFHIGVSTVFPGFIRDAGMFADTEITLPRGVGTNTPEEVAAGVLKAVTDNRGEVDVAPLVVRAGGTLNALVPGLPARLGRRFGADDITATLVERQREKR